MATAPLAANKSGAFVLVLKAVHNAAMFECFGGTWKLQPQIPSAARAPMLDGACSRLRNVLMAQPSPSRAS